MYELRDTIHRTIAFSEDEKRVIDHPFVQRLRHVRQLGLGALVYPGATHDRFSHALGAMHVAGRIWARIMETSGGVLRKLFSDYDLTYFGRVLRFSGLLHDVGHPPFSHVSERFMPPFSALALPAGWFPRTDRARQATHEDFSALLIAGIAEGDAPITSGEARDIASLIHHEVTPSSDWEKRFGPKEGGKGGIHRLLRSLVSGELDCDRMDYLLRDAYFSGVAYGMHDIDHIVSNLGVTETGAGLTLTIDSTAVRAFEDFLLARYHMFLQVYMHKTSMAFDHYLLEAISAGEFAVDVPGDAAGYATLRESGVWEKLFAAAAAKGPGSWSWRLVYRKPPKTLLVSSSVRPDEVELMRMSQDALRRARIPFFTMSPQQSLAKSGAAKSDMLVRRKVLGDIVFEPISRYSSLLNKYNEVIDLTYLYVLPEHAVDALREVRIAAKMPADQKPAPRSMVHAKNMKLRI